MSDEDPCLNAVDLQITISPSQPSSGMIADRVEQGVRVVHIPTGKWSECTLYRHQYQNKREALRLLSEQLNGE
jgi:protein subunit release factor A